MAIHLRTGDSVRDYTIIKCVGAGAEGTVYTARSADGRTVCLKQLNTSIDSDKGSKDLLRSRRVERLIGKHHPNVAGVFEIFTHNHLAYIAMQYLEGDTLENDLNRKGKYSLDYLISILDKLLQALVFLHTHGIVHRDVKPSNIVLTRKSDGTIEPVLIDFGIVLIPGGTRATALDGMLGTPSYMAPEQLKGTAVEPDGRADLFPIGIILFETLTGCHPSTASDFAGMVRWILEGMRPSIPDQPSSITDLYRTLTAVRPADRPASATQARKMWLDIAGRSVSRTPSPPKAKLKSPPPATIPAHSVISSSRPRTLVGRPRHRGFSSGKDECKAPSPACTTSAISFSPPPVLAKPKPSLRIMEGVRAGETLDVPPSGTCLGRTTINEHDKCISRFHVHARVKGGRLILCDVGSKGGLMIDGRRVRRAELSIGESVVVGSTQLTWK